jgi:hypothetical protein
MASPATHHWHELIAAGLLLLAGVVDGDQLIKAVETGYERGKGSLEGYDPGGWEPRFLRFAGYLALRMVEPLLDVAHEVGVTVPGPAPLTDVVVVRRVELLLEARQLPLRPRRSMRVLTSAA